MLNRKTAIDLLFREAILSAVIDSFSFRKSAFLGQFSGGIAIKKRLSHHLHEDGEAAFILLDIFSGHAPPEP
jgi:hypothetical protein